VRLAAVAAVAVADDDDDDDGPPGNTDTTPVNRPDNALWAVMKLASRRRPESGAKRGDVPVG